jgi:hypothetical protein
VDRTNGKKCARERRKKREEEEKRREEKRRGVAQVRVEVEKKVERKE